jgi:hypothetical protein
MFSRIDLVLACALGILGIIMYLLPDKTPTTIIILLAVAFCLSFYIVWTFPWLKESARRRMAGLLAVAICLCLFGYYVWPNRPEKTLTTQKQITKESLPKEKAKQGRARHANSFLRVDPPFPVGGVVHPGDKISLNVRWTNVSQGRVFDILTLSKLYLIKNPSNFSDMDIIGRFNKWMKPFKDDYLAGKIKSAEEVGVGNNVWQTMQTDPLSEVQFDGLFDGSQRIYVVSWCGWKDNEGIRDSVFDCEWLQALPKQGGDLVWHSCVVIK